MTITTLKVKQNERADNIRKNRKLWKEGQRVINDIIFEEAKKYWDAQRALTLDRTEFRHWHIAGSLERGRTYEQIERKVREGNEPNWNRIEEYRGIIKSYRTCESGVRYEEATTTA